MRNVAFVRSDLADRKSFALACLLLFCYASIALHLIYDNTSSKTNIETYDGTLWLDVVFACGTMFVAPFAEEVFFRGWMWGRIEAASGPVHAAILSAVAWLTIHLPNKMHILMLLPPAILLSFLRLRTRSLLPGILLHIMNNSFEIAWFVYLVMSR